MEESPKICRFCGTALPKDSKHCENCGAPAAPQISQPPPHPSSPDKDKPHTLPNKPDSQERSNLQQAPDFVPVPPAQPVRRPGKVNACLVVLGAIGLALICLSLLALAIDYMGNKLILTTLGLVRSTDSVAPESVLRTNEFQTIDPTAEPTPVSNFLPLVMVHDEEREDTVLPYPSPEAAGADSAQNQPPMGQQFFDDFSTTAYGWAELSTDISEFSYSNEAYTILVKSPSYIAWTELPIAFFPNRIEFIAFAAPDHSGGSFGVMCNIQDEGNYYSVEFDLDKYAFSIAAIQDYKIYPMTNPEWVELRNLIPSPGSTNHYMVECLPTKITVYVNGENIGVGTLDGIEPLPNLGNMALFVATWENISGNGYQIFFDNVAAQIAK